MDFLVTQFFLPTMCPQKMHASVRCETICRARFVNSDDEEKFLKGKRRGA
jgi:hypothetical protein